jgi:hypothetical protein
MEPTTTEPVRSLTWGVLRQRDSTTLWHFGSLVCVHFRGPSTIDEISADFAAQNSIIARYGEISQVVVFEADKIGRIGHQMKDKAAEQLEKWGPLLRGSAIVVLGGGLAARFMRVTIAGVMALTGKVRQRVFPSIDESIGWLKTLEGQHGSVMQADAEMLERLIGLPVE